MDQRRALDELFERNDKFPQDQRASVEELLKRNAQIAQSFEPMLTLAEIGKLPLDQQLPMPKIFLVTCDDPRINPWEILGLKRWDAVVALGVAGRIAHQFENMLFLDHFLHFDDIMIIHHTDCSAGIFSNEEIYQGLEERAPGQLGDIELPAYKDLNQSVRDDLQLVKASPLVRKELAARTRGFIYDIKTGKVSPVPE